ncbi:MAG: hypothetical protein ACO1N9_03325 [Flavobacterium sp.]
MKKIFGLLAALLLLTGCDDGDMTFKSFNFGDSNAQACADNGLIYKVQGTEALLLQFAANTFINAENIDPQTGLNVPRSFNIGSGVSMIYRTYNGEVSSASICTDLPPATPSVVDQYVAQAGGTISVLTQKVTNNEGVITGYNHIITIVNATLTKDGESIIITNNVFGTYATTLTYRFDFEDEDSNINLQRCPEPPAFTGKVFTVNGDEALLFNLNMTSFPATDDAVTTIDFSVPTEAQEIIFNEYSGTAVATLFCNVVPPITPVVTKQWEAISGKLRIETNVITGVATEYVFFLDNVVFMNRVQNAEQFAVNATGGYRVGKLTIAN